MRQTMTFQQALQILIQTGRKELRNKLIRFLIKHKRIRLAIRIMPRAKTIWHDMSNIEYPKLNDGEIVEEIMKELQKNFVKK